MRTKFDSDLSYAIFLEEQLAVAAAHIHQARDGEANSAQRYQTMYETRAKQLKDQFDRMTKDLKANAARYWLIRKYMVQIWTLGIAASADNLDQALDKLIERERTKVNIKTL